MKEIPIISVPFKAGDLTIFFADFAVNRRAIYRKETVKEILKISNPLKVGDLDIFLQLRGNHICY